LKAHATRAALGFVGLLPSAPDASEHFDLGAKEVDLRLVLLTRLADLVSDHVFTS
jgi:hypothetical protein